MGSSESASTKASDEV